MRVKKWCSVIYTGVIVLGCIITVSSLLEYRSLPPISTSCHKVVHISFDDVFTVLKELNNEAENYESIFEKDFFRDLKKLHQAYGAKVSLYIFERDSDFNVVDMTIKFREEFKANASWLKFGFHAIQPEFDPNINIEDFQSSFKNTQRAICYFADSSSLTSVLRLHYFYGNRKNIHLLTIGGVKGLLCADDERDSYDLNEQENNILKQKFYFKKNIKYFKTDFRYENTWRIDYALSHLRNRDTLVLFTHEWAYRPLTVRQSAGYLIHHRCLPPNWFVKYSLEKSIKWLREHDYEFVFLE